MKFRLIVKDESREPWHEDYDKSHINDLSEAEAWAKDTIERFNATLQPHETPREVVRVEVLDLEGDDHSWVKTNIVTIIDSKGNYDTVECASCGITGRRHGLGLSGIRRDRKFKALGYDSCKQAKVLLARREKRAIRLDEDSEDHQA